MNRIGQIIVSAVIFIAVSIGLDILLAVLVADNALALNFLGAFPGQSQATYLDRYIGFMATDTLGWLTYVTLGSSQSFEILASTASVYNLGGSGEMLSFLGLSDSPKGLIPIMIEFHPASSVGTVVFIPALGWALKLIVPFLITGLIAGGIANSKKAGIVNAFMAIFVVGIAAIVLNIVHVYFNFELSLAWKFSATATQNPLLEMYLLIQQGLALMGASDMIVYLTATSIVILVFAVINGLICSAIGAIGAAKK